MDYMKLAAAMEDSNEGFLVVDLEGRILAVNEAILRMVGRGRDEVVGFKVVDFLEDESREYVETIIPQVSVTERRRHEEIILLGRNGKRYSLLVNATTFRDAGGKPVGSYMFVTDVTSLRGSEQRLGESLKTVRALLDSATDLMFLLDCDGRVIDMNDSLANAMKLSREELLGQVIFDFFGPGVAQGRRKMADQVFASGRKICYSDENMGRSFVHSITPVRGDNGRVESIAVFVKDVTEELANRRRLAEQEERLFQMRRLESVGCLAGGIAHDFNNLITGILGNASLVKSRFENDSPDRDRVERIIRLGESGARLTGHLLGFARGGMYDPRPIGVRDLVVRAVELFDRTSRGFGVKLDIPGAVGTVSVDSGEMEQVLLNVFVNALQAAGPTGTMTVTASREDLGREEANRMDLVEGAYARISVKDNGPGIPREIIDRIFEPFFSTKEKGIGTGLGLASAYGIVKNHGGVIEGANSDSGGAVFTIFLPLCSADSARVFAHSKANSRGPMEAVRILVIDDEPEVSDVIADILRSSGHEVITAHNGAGARKFLESGVDSFSMVILDMIIRGDSGVALYREFRAASPRMPIVITTGDPEIAADLGRFVDIDGRTVFMKKPFNGKTLLSCVDKALSRR